ncbi:MAG: four helix bundle protein [Bacteroidetes bacterium SW_4_67_19]|nr:MAG: four helix bundle protein [Bacteroidetes bacterium SW_4_67_19]
MVYKFEKLEVWQKALDYADRIHEVADVLPSHEKYGLRSQITRAANSVALNIAEGSTSQSDDEQARFLGMAIRSLVETIACLHLIKRREYLSDPESLRDAYRASRPLFAQLQAFRSSLTGSDDSSVKEEQGLYDAEGDVPF